MEATAAIVLYILLILVPINGLMFIGARNERIRSKRLLMQYWRFRGK